MTSPCIPCVQILMSVSFQILLAVIMLSVVTHWAVLYASVILDSVYLMVKIIALVRKNVKAWHINFVIM